jgi:hypothetical protein
VKLLVGTEAIKNKSRGSGGTGVGFDFEDPTFITLNTSGIPAEPHTLIILAKALFIQYLEDWTMPIKENIF